MSTSALWRSRGHSRRDRRCCCSTSQPPAWPYLIVGRLEAGYGAEPVLKGVDLQVRSRELVAVLGANGAGKSTLMRAISGLLRPVAGGVSVDGDDIARLPAHRVAALGVS